MNFMHPWRANKEGIIPLIVVDVAAGAYAVLFVVTLPLILPCWLIGFGLRKLGLHPGGWQ